MSRQRDPRPSRPRGRSRWLVVATAATAIQLFAGATPGFSSSELAEVRAATAQFHRVSAAEDAGWLLLTEVPPLGDCFESPGDGAMGYHYINPTLLDEVVDPGQPEALVYAPGPNGSLHLAAVEWIIPTSEWTDTAPPTVMGHDMHLNATLPVWVLHAWIFQHNPAGMFADWNPRVTCP